MPMTSILVPDAGVFTKLYYSEPDSADAAAFFEMCARMNAKLVVPELFKYEIAQTSRYIDQPLADTLDLLDAHLAAIMTIAAPDREAWLLAEGITKEGHVKSGFPSIYDSIYHALAIQLDGVFVTADKRHYAKARSRGHIMLLEDWPRIFAEIE